MFEQRLCKFDDDIEKLMCMHTHRKAVNVWENEICIDNLVLDTLPKLLGQPTDATCVET